MRKLIALAVVCTTALVFAAVAYAVNVYTVTPASTKGGGGAKGTSAKPVPKAVKFGFKTKDSGGGRATPIKKYKIGFQGLKYFGKNKVFPKCTFAKVNQKLESDVKADCGKAYLGKGVVNNLVGVTGSTVTTTTCLLRLTLYNTGRGFALRLDGGNTAKPPTKCPIAVNQAINAFFQLRKVGGTTKSASLEFSVPSNLLHPGSPNISNAIETTNSTISGKARKVKIKGKTRKVSILSSVKCGKKNRTIQVAFTDEKNSTVNAKKKVKC
jgi:hypothetical protein